MKTAALILMVLITGETFCAPGDSVNVKTPKKNSRTRITTRAHSMGLFSYGGRLVTSSPVMDINIQYDRKTWGFQLFKAMDLRDSRTPINFCLAAFNKNFHIGKKITVTPSVGVILEEYESIADHGSDAAVILTTAYKMNRHFTLEHSTLAGNLVLEPNMRDWVNRLRLLYSFGHLDVTLMGWHNNRCFDDIGYFTYGSSVFYSRAKLSPGLSINAGITGLVMAFTSNEAVLPPSNGVFLTLAVVVDQKTPFN